MKLKPDEIGYKKRMLCGCVLTLISHDKIAHLSVMTMNWSKCDCHIHDSSCRPIEPIKGKGDEK
jgi:hypothetical protein